jgi:hypothetical protein
LTQAAGESGNGVITSMVVTAVESFLDTWQYNATDPERVKQQLGWIELLHGNATLSDSAASAGVPISAASAAAAIRIFSMTALKRFVQSLQIIACRGRKSCRRAVTAGKKHLPDFTWL